MSHIDSFQHEIVGFFAGLPVYHPLEDINGDFKCTPKHLLIGGGNGEHPALVLKNPLAAVAWFIEDSLEELDKTTIIRSEWENIIDPYLIYDSKNILAYYDWRIETYQEFAERCKSASLPNPHSTSECHLEAWLILGFGEFIYYAMPDLGDEIMSKLKKPYELFKHMRYNNIMLIPPNIPVYANQGNAFSSSHRSQISN
ncbi:MAG: hypothetical protein AAFO95_09725 [Cyanobacteria bacterium J06600_6]